MLKAYLKLLRYPLAITAVSNVIAGSLIASGPAGIEGWRLGLACLASVLLYSAGMILNDVFDAPKDRARGRSRPIPDGEISRRLAAVLGVLHLAAGILVALPLGSETLLWTGVTALFVVLYDGVLRQPALLGVVMMGCARGANVMIGVGVGGGWEAAWNQEWVIEGMNAPEDVWLHPLAIMLYTIGVTLESLREDHLGRSPLPHLPFNLAFHCLPAAALGAWMCDDHSPFAQVFWVVPALLGFANGRAYARQPSMMSARRTVRDGLLGIPCMDAVVVSTVLSTQSRMWGIFLGAGVAAFAIIAYVLMRLSAPRGSAPTADDQIDLSSTSGSSRTTRFQIEERSTNRVAMPDGTFAPGGSWHVLRCQIPASSPTRFLVGVSERDPDRPRLVTVRIRPLDIPSVHGLAQAFAKSADLAAPANLEVAEPGWIDLEARVVAQNVERATRRTIVPGMPAPPPQAEGEEGSPRPGDWNFYDARWEPARSGHYLHVTIGVNEVVGVGEIAFQPSRAESSWNLLLRELGGKREPTDQEEA